MNSVVKQGTWNHNKFTTHISGYENNMNDLWIHNLDQYEWFMNSPWIHSSLIQFTWISASIAIQWGFPNCTGGELMLLHIQQACQQVQILLLAVFSLFLSLHAFEHPKGKWYFLGQGRRQQYFVVKSASPWAIQFIVLELCMLPLLTSMRALPFQGNSGRSWQPATRSPHDWQKNLVM